MKKIVRACLYTVDPSRSDQLLQQLAAMDLSQTVKLARTADELTTLIKGRELNLILFHLDPDPTATLKLIDQVSVRHPELALIGLSAKSDPHSILTAMRSGCDQFLCEPIAPAEFEEAIGRIASKGRLSHKTGRCVCVTGACGGSGTTSIACSLATEIALLTGTTCALVDLDLQFGTVALTFDCEPEYSLYDLAMEQADGELDRWVVDAAMKTLPCNVSILSRPETYRQQKAITPEVLRRAMGLLAGTYENIIIDVPRRLDPCSFAVLDQADLITVVCQLLVPSVGNAIRYIDMMSEMGIDKESVEIIVNRVDGTDGLVTIDSVEKAIDKPVFAKIPSDFLYMSNFLNLGQPNADRSENKAIRIAMSTLAHQIVHRNKGISDRKLSSDQIGTESTS